MQKDLSEETRKREGVEQTAREQIRKERERAEEKLQKELLSVHERNQQGAEVMEQMMEQRIQQQRKLERSRE